MYNRDNPNTAMKEEYREKINELLDEIENTEILEYLYIFIRGKVEGYIKDEKDK